MYRATVEIVGRTLPNGRNGHIAGGLGLVARPHPMRLPHDYVYAILHLTLQPPKNASTLRKVTHVYEQPSLYSLSILIVRVFFLIADRTDQ
eukprot:COSAG01_NODE_15058_length_1379_cov_1.408594_1_plen_90_part_10